MRPRPRRRRRRRAVPSASSEARGRSGSGGCARPTSAAASVVRRDDAHRDLLPHPARALWSRHVFTRASVESRQSLRASAAVRKTSTSEPTFVTLSFHVNDGSTFAVCTRLDSSGPAVQYGSGFAGGSTFQPAARSDLRSASFARPSSCRPRRDAAAGPSGRPAAADATPDGEDDDEQDDEGAHASRLPHRPCRAPARSRGSGAASARPRRAACPCARA